MANPQTISKTAKIKILIFQLRTKHKYRTIFYSEDIKLQIVNKHGSLS